VKPSAAPGDGALERPAIGGSLTNW
jgi:hypothetical protein